jgi:hypothetical protein
MFRQLLAWFIPRHRLFRIEATRSTEADTHEPPCASGLGKVYHHHATIHGHNTLLPLEALPHPPEPPRTSEVSSRAELT